jgi:hypothetical protein
MVPSCAWRRRYPGNLDYLFQLRVNSGLPIGYNLTAPMPAAFDLDDDERYQPKPEPGELRPP